MPNTSIIVKDNNLIEFRGRLTEYENKIMNWCAVQIGRSDVQFEYCELTRHEAAILLSKEDDPVEGKANITVKQIKDILEGLYKKTIEIKSTNSDSYERFSLITKDSYDSDRGIFSIRISNDLKPYLLQLSKNFTKLNFIDLMQLKHTHSPRFYEMCMKELYNLHVASFTRTIEELKEKLGISDKYKRYTDFEKFVLKPSQKDLKEVGLTMTWDPDKYHVTEKIKGYPVTTKKRSYQRLHFNVRVKDPRRTGAWMQISSFGIKYDQIKGIFNTYDKDVIISVLKRWGSKINSGTLDDGSKIHSKAAFFIAKLKDMANVDKQLDMEYDQQHF